MACGCNYSKMSFMGTSVLYEITKDINSLCIDTEVTPDSRTRHAISNGRAQICIRSFMNMANQLTDCTTCLTADRATFLNGNIYDMTPELVTKTALSPTHLLKVTKKIIELLDRHRIARKDGLTSKIGNFLEKTFGGRESIKDELTAPLQELEISLATLAADITDNTLTDRQAGRAPIRQARREPSAPASYSAQTDNRSAISAASSQQTNNRSYGDSDYKCMVYAPPSTDNET